MRTIVMIGLLVIMAYAWSNGTIDNEYTDEQQYLNAIQRSYDDEQDHRQLQYERQMGQKQRDLELRQDQFEYDTWIVQRNDAIQ